MARFLKTMYCISLSALLISAPVAGAATLVELSAESSRPALNDLIRATVAAEASGAVPGELARQVNTLTADALKTARAYPSVKIKSNGTSTYPIYSRAGKIDSWRMRSELALESGDSGALSELLGKIQQSLGVTSLTTLPAPETRKKAEDEAMLDAIAAFKARAQVIAGTFGKPYHIKQLSVNSSGAPGRPLPMLRMAAKAVDSSMPMPVEAGDSQVSVNVSGQIEIE